MGRAIGGAAGMAGCGAATFVGSLGALRPAGRCTLTSGRLIEFMRGRGLACKSQAGGRGWAERSQVGSRGAQITQLNRSLRWQVNEITGPGGSAPPIKFFKVKILCCPSFQSPYHYKGQYHIQGQEQVISFPRLLARGLFIIEGGIDSEGGGKCQQTAHETLDKASSPPSLALFPLGKM